MLSILLIKIWNKLRLIIISFVTFFYSEDRVNLVGQKKKLILKKKKCINYLFVRVFRNTQNIINMF